MSDGSAPSRLVVLVLAGALALGCSTTTSKLRTRFAKEHACPESQVTVTESGGAVYRASGCERHTEYVCESFANMEDSARGCQERGLHQKAPAGGDRPRFPESPEQLPPPGGAPR